MQEIENVYHGVPLRSKAEQDRLLNWGVGPRTGQIRRIRRLLCTDRQVTEFTTDGKELVTSDPVRSDRQETVNHQ